MIYCSNDEAIQKLAQKMMEIFNEGSVKTLADLAARDAENLPGVEKLPDVLKNISLSPDTACHLPQLFWAQCYRGVPSETLIRLYNQVSDFRYEIYSKAKHDLSLG